MNDVGNLFDGQRSVGKIQYCAVVVFGHFEYEFVVVGHYHAVSVEGVLRDRMIFGSFPECRHEIDVFDVVTVVFETV